MKQMLLSLVFSLIVAVSARAADWADTSAVGAAMTTAASKFLSQLDDQQKSAVLLSFDDPARLDWHNIPKPRRKGIQVRDMNPAQREACHALLQAALSQVGYEKAVRIMALENNLHEGEKNLQGGHLRDPERYFLTLFGNPSLTGTWGWSFEGHHLSLNFVIQDGQVTGDTPSFWGAKPATVHLFIPGGPEKGIRTLAAEEQLAFDLLHSLDDQQRAKAIIADKAPGDYRAAGKPTPPAFAPEGLAVQEMSD